MAFCIRSLIWRDSLATWSLLEDTTSNWLSKRQFSPDARNTLVASLQETVAWLAAF